MLNEVKHPGREREVSIVTEGPCDGRPGAPGLTHAFVLTDTKISVRAL